MATVNSMKLLSQKCDTRFDLMGSSDMKRLVVKTANETGYSSWAAWIREAIAEKLEREGVIKQ